MIPNPSEQYNEPLIDPDMLAWRSRHQEPELAPIAALEERYDGLLSELRLQETEAPDSIMRALFTRLNGALETDIPLHDTLRKYVQYNKDDSLSVSIRKIYSAFQQFVIPLPPHHRVLDTHGEFRDPKFPLGYDEPAGWDNVFQLLKQEEHLVRLRVSLITKDLQSNVITRFTPLRVGAQLFGLTDVHIYSGGASFGIVEKMEKLYQPGRLHLPADVVVGRQDMETDFAFMPSETLTRDYRRLLDAPYKVGKIIAGDIDPPTDPLTAIWGYSNSFRGGEFANRKYRELVNRMLVKHIPGMHYTAGFDYGDFTSPDHVKLMRKKFPWWFELPNRKVQLVTTGHNNSPQDDERAHDNMRQLAGDDGVIFWSDFIGLGLDGSLHRKKGRWLAGDYNLYAEDMKAGDGIKHIFKMSDGRSTKIALGQHVTRLVAGALRPQQAS